MSDTVVLNESQQRRLLANARYADKLLSDVEDILRASESRSPFPKYRPDISLHQARLIRSHFARFRDHLSRVLSAVGIEHDGPQFGSLHSILVTLLFVRIAVQEMAPEHLRGYGLLSPNAEAELRGLCSELQGLIDGLERNLALGAGADLQARIDRLERTSRETELIRLLDRIVNENELAEFRATLLNIVEKLESRLFEIAVFGRVSSGKSSLLNHILRTDVLPVGVNPITAVPTRLVYSREAQLSITFADRREKHYTISELANYASEEQNPGNEKGVTRLVVQLPSARLQNGLVLVDTPGLGALATSGAAETMSYLPQCDLGIVLISAVNPINDEDLNTISALSQAGSPVMALLSKADLLSPPDRLKAVDYTKKQVRANLGLEIEVHPVSTVGQTEELLERWFSNQLEPLFGKHQELAQQSVRRKTGALREAVISALRARLGPGLAPSGAAAEDLPEIERQLRGAAGEIEEARRFCLDATDEVRSLGAIALQRSVQAVIDSWNGRGAGAISETPVARTVEKLASEAASQIAGRLRTLAQHLRTALANAAEALDGRDFTVHEDSLGDCIREMPRFEIALPDARILPPWFRWLGPVVRPWVAGRLKIIAGSGLEAGFVNYGRTLEAWVRKVLTQLQREFDERADAYRAQLSRLMSHKAPSPADRARLERDLAELEGMLAEDLKT